VLISTAVPPVLASILIPNYAVMPLPYANLSSNSAIANGDLEYSTQSTLEHKYTIALAHVLNKVISQSVNSQSNFSKCEL